MKKNNAAKRVLIILSALLLIALPVVTAFAEGGDGSGGGNNHDNPLIIDFSKSNIAEDKEKNKNIEPDFRIALYFTKNVVNFTVCESNKKCFSLKDETEGKSVEINVEMGDDQVNPTDEIKRTVYISGKEPFGEGHSYTLTVSNGIHAKSGAQLDKTYHIGFTVKGELPTTTTAPTTTKPAPTTAKPAPTTARLAPTTARLAPTTARLAPTTAKPVTTKAPSGGSSSGGSYQVAAVTPADSSGPGSQSGGGGGPVTYTARVTTTREVRHYETATVAEYSRKAPVTKKSAKATTEKTVTEKAVTEGVTEPRTASPELPATPPLPAFEEEELIPCTEPAGTEEAGDSIVVETGDYEEPGFMEETAEIYADGETAPQSRDLELHNAPKVVILVTAVICLAAGASAIIIIKKKRG